MRGIALRTSTTRVRRGAASALLAVTLAVGGTLVGSGTSPAGAQANPYERGPAPTNTSIEQPGTFAVSTATVASQTNFGGGTIYYPTSTASGTFAGIALSPGFTETQSYLQWLAQRLATHGFVVININTLNNLETPNVRADELQAALTWLTSSASPVRTRVDASRLGVGGHSMGGGGTIEAANERPTLKAAVAFQPWHSVTSWPNVRVPIMIQGATNDTIAPIAQHSEAFYPTLTGAPEKAYVEFAGADHFASGATGKTALTSRFTVAWFKRFLDNDTRYDQFLCPKPVRSDLTEYRDTCPHGGGGGTTTTTRPGTTTTTRPTTTTTTAPPACQWWDWWCLIFGRPFGT
jgi:dienelactone hydrolase